MAHEILDDLNRRMAKTVEVFEHELVSVRTGRASVACWIRFGLITTDNSCR